MRLAGADRTHEDEILFGGYEVKILHVFTAKSGRKLDLRLPNKIIKRLDDMESCGPDHTVDPVYLTLVKFDLQQIGHILLCIVVFYFTPVFCKTSELQSSHHLFNISHLLRLFIFPKALYRNTTLVMRAFSVLFTPVKQVAVELFKADDRGDRNEDVASDVADLVLNIAFRIARCRIAEISLKAIMQHKPCKAFGELSLGTFKHLRNCRRHIIKAYPRRYAAAILKDTAHTDQQALLIL